MFVLGFLYWMYNRSLDSTIQFLKEKFGKKPDILESNILALKAGFNYGDTTEAFQFYLYRCESKTTTGYLSFDHGKPGAQPTD